MIPAWMLWTGIVVLGSIVGYAVGRIHEREKNDAGYQPTPDELRAFNHWLDKVEEEF